MKDSLNSLRRQLRDCNDMLEMTDTALSIARVMCIKFNDVDVSSVAKLRYMYRSQYDRLISRIKRIGQ